MIVLGDGHWQIRYPTMLINVVEFKAREIGFIEAMQFVMFAPKAWLLIPWHCDEQSSAM